MDSKLSGNGGCGSRFQFDEGLTIPVPDGEELTEQELNLANFKNQYLQNLAVKLGQAEGNYNRMYSTSCLNLYFIFEYMNDILWSSRFRDCRSNWNYRRIAQWSMRRSSRSGQSFAFRI